MDLRSALLSLSGTVARATESDIDVQLECNVEGH